VACVSSATLRDARRLLNGYRGQLILATNVLNHPYGVLDRPEATRRLETIDALRDGVAFLLNVGSNLRRKNREGVLRAVASMAPSWSGKIVFAGQPLTTELRTLAVQLQIAHRVVEVVKPSNDLLEALYNRALALLFPSRFEGFGWPIIEAQACGCPVVCSDREPFPEVSGGAASMCSADDPRALGQAILALAASDSIREDLQRRGLENARRYREAASIEQFTGLYRELTAAA
jgi:glycosyltransferase involved in cell wall biosynthesis